MKLNIKSKKNEVSGSIEAPDQFKEYIRSDVITRAVESEQSKNRQAYGSAPDAGKRHSAFLSKRRRDYRGTYGIGQSRTPRKVMSRSGRRLNFVGAFAPQTVGGRRSHPPKSDKIWIKEINKKETNLALRCAMSATVLTEEVTKRGHNVPKDYPFILDNEIEKVSKTKEILAILKEFGLSKELGRTKEKKIRPGKGKTRGRKYKKKKGPLFVVSASCNLQKALKNIPGIDVTTVDNLTVESLAPGAHPGRMTFWTKDSITKIAKEGLYK